MNIFGYFDKELVVEGTSRQLIGELEPSGG
jgi:hypothetical protein